MKSFIRMILSLVSVFVGLGALGAYDSSSPAVPIGIVVKGRQAVTQYLLGQVDYVEVKITGKSVVTSEFSNTYYLSHEWLANAGYKFDGSFGALSQAIGTVSFTAELMPVESGNFDAQLSINFFSQTGKSLMEGGAWLNIHEGLANQLTAVAEPWVSINGSIDIVFPVELGPQAKWFTLDYRSRPEQEFYTDRFGDISVIQNVPSSLIGYGYLATTDRIDGSVHVINLATGEVLSPDHVRVLMGQFSSSDVRVVSNPTDGNWMNNTQFYLSEGQVYGRAPLLEVVGRGLVYKADFSVSVWGGETRVYPVMVTVKSLSDGREVTYGKEFNIYLAPGVTYQIVVDYGGQVRDWDADPNPKG